MYAFPIVSFSSLVKALAFRQAILSKFSITADMSQEKVIKNHNQFKKSIFYFNRRFGGVSPVDFQVLVMKNKMKVH